MKELFEDIKRLYGESFKEHGDSPKSLLTPKGRHHLRFRAIDPFVSDTDISVLDFGCGLGYLHKYLEHYPNIRYTGIDITPEFIEACREKFPQSEFKHIDPWQPLSGAYDIVFSSGVFNLKTHADSQESKRYAFDRLKSLFMLTKEVMICDFLSAFVDFEQPGAQHFSVAELSEFCYAEFGHRFQIRHDLLPYELTLIVWRDQEIRRPENIFEADGI